MEKEMKKMLYVRILTIGFFLLLLTGVGIVSSQSSITTTIESFEDCTYRWFCTDWIPAKCPENGVQARSCTNAGNCPDDYQKPEEKRGCVPANPRQLFDIKLELEEKEIYNVRELVAWTRFESFGVEPTPVNLTFIILDRRGREVYVKKESIVVETERFVVERFKGLDLEPGEYVLILKTLYNTDVEDAFEQEFAFKERIERWVYAIAGFVVLAFIYLIVLWRKRKD